MHSESTETLHDKEAEEAVLGAMMTDRAVIPRVVSALGHTSEPFFTTDHQLIYAAIISSYERHNQVDPLLVANELEKIDQLNRAGGAVYLYDLQAKIVETENTELYAQIVQEKWLRRQLVRASQQINTLAHDQERELNDVLSQAQEEVFRLSHADARRGSVLIAPLVREVLKEVEDSYGNEHKILGVSTGFFDIDVMTSGLQPGDLSIIAARPSMGKSTLVLNIAQNIARNNLPVLIFSLEMPARHVIMRMLAAETGIDFSRLRTGKLTDDHWESLTQGTSSLISAPIFINDARGLTVQELRAEGRRLKGEREDLAVIIVDYLQLLSGSSKYYGRVEEISDISRSLKTLAWELNVPIIACSQLSREVERRPDKRPQLSDLRESGAIEQDADVVAFLYREDYYDDQTEEDQGLADLIIKKQRNGPTGTIQLEFHKKLMRFSDIPV
jgi:replicative DNA helicase